LTAIDLALHILFRWIQSGIQVEQISDHREERLEIHRLVCDQLAQVEQTKRREREEKEKDMEIKLLTHSSRKRW
jgi:hypothetical protein